MNRQEFLDRIIAPGNFIAISTKPPDRGLFNRFFARDNVRGASRFLDWAASHKRWDTWYAPASFKAAALQADDKYRGQRTQANVEALKCFWFDADVSRPGDGKDASKVFGDVLEVVAWVKQFAAAAKLPLPNLWVCSGYGVHLYWAFEDAIPRAEWQPHAEALKAALLAHGAKGDASVVADAARILRPVDTFNYKDTQPAPCYEIAPERLTKPDYPNALLLGAIAALPAYTRRSTGLTGKPALALVNTKMTANARLDARPRDFGVIASQCGQVRRSLDEGGAHDERMVWHDLITLSRFCTDGRQWAHRIGDQHPKYAEADTDQEFDLAEAEYQQKKFGAPLCKTLMTNSKRPEICAACPHREAVETPYSLGLPPLEPDDLPLYWRRHKGTIETKDKEGNWVKLLDGNVSNPVLERVANHLRLGFDYTPLGGKPKRVHVENTEIEIRTSKRIFSERGVPLSFDNDRAFGRLTLAWIDLLHKSSGGHVEAVAPAFGWHRDGGGNRVGLSIGGVCYRADGTEYETGGGDRTLIGYYQPRGTFDAWQKAAELVIDGKPVLQVAFAVSFGALLMEYTGEAGMSLNFVGPSGRGKSSVFRAGAAVWGQPNKTMLQLDDTVLSVSHRIGDIRTYPCYWDEANINDRYKAASLKELLHKITQGRDKSRLTSDIKLREMGEWKTLFPFSSNDSLVSALSGLPGDNSATLLRMLEIPVDVLPPNPDPAAKAVIADLDHNYGHAGRRFIQAIIGRADKLSAFIQQWENKLIKIAQADNVERFYTAGGAAILAGAELASKLQLVRNLDLASMQDVIVNAIINSRGRRDEHAPVDPIQLALKILDNFCDDNIGRRMVTQSIPTSPGASKVISKQLGFLVQSPTMDQYALAYQIGIGDKVMRINKRVWVEWTLRRGMSPDVLDATDWQIEHKEPRAILGAGTAYITERVRVIELDLNQSELRHFVEGYAPAPHDDNVIRLPTPPRP